MYQYIKRKYSNKGESPSICLSVQHRVKLILYPVLATPYIKQTLAQVPVFSYDKLFSVSISKLFTDSSSKKDADTKIMPDLH